MLLRDLEFGLKLQRNTVGEARSFTWRQAYNYLIYQVPPNKVSSLKSVHRKID